MQKVHVYSIDRARQTGVIEATNPTRMYIQGREGEDDYVAPVQVQMVGTAIHFYDQSGEVEIERAEVPEYILADLIRDPLRLAGQTPEQVMKFCQFCPEPENAIPSGEWESHLIRHIGAYKAQLSAPNSVQAEPVKRGRGRPRKVAPAAA